MALMYGICAPHSLHNAILNAKVKVFIQNTRLTQTSTKAIQHLLRRFSFVVLIQIGIEKTTLSPTTKPHSKNNESPKTKCKL